jgi:UDP-N-acetylmuramoyl-L-alanyl-D-glutamate--2,6-diaminopimelate ligase
VVTEGDALGGLSVAQVLVPSARRALARLAGAFYGHPSAALTLVGITGTNGKTTTSYLVDALLRARGLRTGIIGTIQYVVGAETRVANQTTPEALELEAMLAEMHAAGVGGVAMEVSSHALALNRVDELQFDVAVFTNLTQDHLDFHGSLEEYRGAKRRLFELLAASPKPRRTAVVSADDPAGAEMVRGLDLPVLAFGLGEGARVRALEHTSTLQGIRMTVQTPRGPLSLVSPLVGEHNVMNLLGAIATGLALGLEPSAIAGALGPVSAVPGRFEQVSAGQPFLVVVDYAHTPDALERVLATARKIARPARRGVRVRRRSRPDEAPDHGRSPPARRTARGPPPTTRAPSAPRRSSTRSSSACDGRRRGRAPGRSPTGAWPSKPRWLGQAGDTIVIAGKGHETYQIIGAQTLAFDDREVARGFLAGRSHA